MFEILSFVRNFNTSTNNIQTRITRMFSKALQNEKAPLASHYGSVMGLAELGQEVSDADWKVSSSII